MKACSAAFVLLAMVAAAAAGQEKPGWTEDPLVTAGLAAIPTQMELANGRLRVVNMYALQGAVLRDMAGASDHVVLERLVQELYAPHAGFWAGYLGDEAAFRRWAPALLDPAHPLHERLPALLKVDMDRRFTDAVEWLHRTTGRSPAGTWYLLFGPGWTDMGGVGGGSMLADFTNMPPDAAGIANLLPHELAHQVHQEAAATDPAAGTVLYRIVAEGLGSYASWVYGDGAISEARAIAFTDQDWQWALQHEAGLWAAALPILESRERSDVDLVAHRGRALVPGAPGAAGYFLGFRMVQAYVAAHGANSWIDLFDLPVAAVLERSGYGAEVQALTR
jgi:hypothetical protein